MHRLAGHVTARTVAVGRCTAPQLIARGCLIGLTACHTSWVRPVPLPHLWFDLLPPQRGQRVHLGGAASAVHQQGLHQRASKN